MKQYYLICVQMQDVNCLDNNLWISNNEKKLYYNLINLTKYVFIRCYYLFNYLLDRIQRISLNPKISISKLNINSIKRKTIWDF